MPRTYNRSDVLDIAGQVGVKVPPQHLSRWLDAKIIVPRGGGGSQGQRREFDLRNILEVIVAERAHSLSLNEAGIRALVTLVSKSSARTLRNTTGKPVIWFGYPASHTVYRNEERVAKAVIKGSAEVAEYLDSGYYGVIIGLYDIVWQIERATGETIQ